MDTRLPLSVEDELKMLVETRAREAAPRIERVEAAGRVFWVKRPERLSLRYRLQKGDPRRAFERERQGLHEMGAAHAPVPELAAEGADYIVLPDCGPNLPMLWLRDAPAFGRPLLIRAGQTLGRLHGLGFSHGRPSPKDMCLDQDRLLILDLERYDPRNNTLAGHARDLAVFAFNVLAHSPNVSDHLPEALEAYRAEAPRGSYEAAQEWCRRMRWADWVTKPIQWRSGNKAREFKALPQLFELFRA